MKRIVSAVLVLLLTLLTLFGCAPAAEKDYYIPDDYYIPIITASESDAAPPADGAVSETTATTTTAPPTTTVTTATTAPPTNSTAPPTAATSAAIDKNGVYCSKDDVALYIYTYGCLPSNFITKQEAQELGWEGGSLEPYAPGKCIGGNSFSNREGLLPKASGRKYTECDINTLGKKSRGAERIVFSNDGLIYYTGDHYESFTLLYTADGAV